MKKLTAPEQYLTLTFLLITMIAGGFYEYTSALATLLLMAGLTVYIRKEKKWSIHVNDALFLCIGVPLAYLLTIFWAVDRGLAVWGFVKYLPILFFGLLCAVVPMETRKKILNYIPGSGCIMFIGSIMLGFLPALKQQFWVAGRLAGFFLYPNTFACFLLVGIILLIEKTEKKSSSSRKDTIQICLLAIGLFLSASRAVLVLAVPVLFVLFYRQAQNTGWKSTGKTVLSLLLPFVLTAIIWTIAQASLVEHLTAFSPKASTLLGRILYWKDALPLIATNPIGLGREGYSLLQGQIQNGVYATRSVHNGLLQLILDAGWLPGILLVIAVFRAFISKNTSFGQKSALFVLFFHSLFDMNMDYLATWFILLLCLDWQELKLHKFSTYKSLHYGFLTVLGVLSCWIGIGSLLYYSGHPNVAAAIYPWNTYTNMDILVATEDPAAQEKIADKILAQDSNVTIAWDVKANRAYAAGDLNAYVTCKQKAISTARYTYEEYLDYFMYLQEAAEHYLGRNDISSASYVIDKMEQIPSMLQNLESTTDPIAWKIADRPILELPQDYLRELENLKNQCN